MHAEGNGTFVLKSSQVFLYDGWNMIGEFSLQNSSFILQRSYEWGPDVSGSFTGAGGVGGLILLRQPLQPSILRNITSKDEPQTAFAPLYDGNGNVTELCALSTSTVAARYEYSAFGETITTDGSAIADSNPFRFSTKYEDRETGLYYYGYRYYAPETGRWLSRDPIGEHGGLNLYGMVRNDPVNRWDLLGLADDVQATPKEAPKECCKKEGVKATNCLIITIWKAKGWGSMAFGHASFGLPGDTRYGFHGDGYLDDDKDMKGYDKENEFECCCLTDKEVEELKAKIEKVKKKIKDKDKTDLEGNEYSVFNTHDPNPTCSGTAAGFAAGMGCPNVAPTNGTRPYELNDALSKNDFCSKN